MQQIYLSNKVRHYLSINGWKKVFCTNKPKKQAGVPILISNKIDFQPKAGKDTSYSSKEKIYQDDILILNIYASHTNITTFVKETLLKLKSHIEPLTLIVGDFNTLLSPPDMLSRQKLNREVIKLIGIMYQMDLRDIYRISHPNARE